MNSSENWKFFQSGDKISQCPALPNTSVGFQLFNYLVQFKYVVGISPPGTVGISIMWEEKFIKALEEDLSSRQAANPRYSIRAYAKHLKVAPATLSDILRRNKSWNLRKERAAEIVSRMGISISHKNRLLAVMGILTTPQRKDLEIPDYNLLTNWSHSAILFAHGLPVKMRTSEELAKRFGIEQKEVEEIINHLVRMNLLKKSSEGDHLEANRADWFAESAPPAEIIREHHKTNMKLALRSVEEVEANKRDLSALTFTGSLENIEEIRKEIRAFHEKIMRLMDYGEKNTEVIQLSIALFPVHFEKKE